MGLRELVQILEQQEEMDAVGKRQSRKLLVGGKEGRGFGQATVQS